MKIADIFNAQDMPRLNRNAPNFTRETIGLIRDSKLVMIFDRAANPNAIAAEIAEAHDRAYLSEFILVSRDGGGRPVYKKTYTITPYWTGDSLADAVAKGNARMQWQREFKSHILRQWDKLHRESAATVTFSNSFVITSAMTDKDKDHAAYDGLYKIVKRELEAGERKLRQAEREKSFDGDMEASLAHRALSSLMMRPDRLEAFIYIPAEMNVKYMQERLVKAANLFQIPAGTDFNGQPMVAFPGDDLATAEQRTQDARRTITPPGPPAP
jgi:hypothetical protein